MGLSRERPSVPNVANKFLVLFFFVLIKTMLCFFSSLDFAFVSFEQPWCLVKTMLCFLPFT